MIQVVIHVEILPGCCDESMCEEVGEEHTGIVCADRIALGHCDSVGEPLQELVFRHLVAGL